MIEGNADIRLQVAVEGGTLLGFGSANPRTTDRFTEGIYSTFYGRALAAIKTGKDDLIKLSVSGNGMQSELILKKYQSCGE